MKQHLEEGLRQDEGFLRKSFHESLMPCMLSILSGTVNILVDGIVVGQRIGTPGLSAISLCVPVYLALCVAGSFLVSGAAIEASRAIGRRETEKTQQFYHTAVWSGLVLSLLVTAGGLAVCTPLAALLCPDPVVRPLVRTYTWVTLLGALPKIMIYVPFWFLRMDGRAREVARMMVVMGAGNVVLDVIFLYPMDLGIGGAAWASVLSTGAACLLGFIWLCDGRSGFRPGRDCITDPAEWKAIAASGSPAALNNLFQTLRLLAVNALLLQAGGSQLVAAFTAVNCISAFSLCVVDGIPQAAGPILGICNGERDNGSAVLLIRRAWRTGVVCCAVFGVAVILGADAIAFVYGLPLSLRGAMVFLAAGMFPALWCSILCGYYTVSGRARWANSIIFCRVFLAAAASLYLSVRLGWDPWWFLLLAELLTLGLWCVAASGYHRRHPRYSRWLLMDRTLEESGRVLNFSVEGEAAKVCEASEQISAFCGENRLDPRQSMRFSLALEEVMMRIVQANPRDRVRFDVRVFSVPGELGIRIRYDGRPYDPFGAREAGAEEDYLGIDLIRRMGRKVVYQRTFGANTVQILL